MARDYAKKKPPQASKRKAEPRVPAWVWLFTGAVLGAFIMFLMRLADMSPQETAKEVKEKTAANSAKNEEQKPRFDFYELLKDAKVPTPKPDTSGPSGAAAEPEAPATEYILQVASFKNKTDAEALRAQLILLNLDATVQDAKVRNGETWYRVLVGPYQSRSRMSKARSTLISNRFEALVLKRNIEN
ncbi:SPOR domain-containing protein [Saccharophagus degradans]|uniref:SPOR domain-containing protein n=1 Tax=Saccharophagus degradans TaxID=86304 RepID=UPI002477FB2B|nr:SPOR domain-containing protein [Saccharophagus degradans]WGO99841.1 SPOR domain-containing protein [Saccharophagus degradans]